MRTIYNFEQFINPFKDILFEIFISILMLHLKNRLKKSYRSHSNMDVYEYQEANSRHHSSKLQSWTKILAQLRKTVLFLKPQAM